MSINQVTGATVSNAAGTQATATASCPAGTVLTGGGGFAAGTYSAHQDLNSSYPQSATVWRIYVDNPDSSAHNIQAYAICTTPSSLSGPARAEVSK